MELVRVTDTPQQVALDPSALREEDYRRALKIVSWTYDERSGALSIVRKAPHIVGRAVVGDKILSVVPDIPPGRFADFLLYAAGIDLRRFLSREVSGVLARSSSGHDDLLLLLAYLMIASAEALSKGYLAKSYEPRQQLLQTLRGRPSWTKNFGRHPATGLICDYHELQQDNVLNQLVLAGLEAASALLDNASGTNAARVLFVWRSLCKRVSATPSMFDAAWKRLNRLTEAYRPALVLARSLLFGFTAEDLFGTGSHDLQCMQFDVALIYERFLERLLEEHFRVTRVRVRKQQGDRAAMLDGWSRTYRSIRPDFSLTIGGQPIAVLDAKYKPKYVSENNLKVSNEDLYQMFFYGSRALANGKQSAIRLAILAPVIGTTNVLPKSEDLTVRWTAAGEKPLKLEVVPVELEPILARLRAGASATAALAESKALYRLCSDLAEAADPHQAALAVAS